MPRTTLNLSELPVAAASTPELTKAISATILTPVLESVIGKFKEQISKLVNEALDPCLLAVQSLTKVINEQATELEAIKTTNATLGAVVDDQKIEIQRLHKENHTSSIG